MAFYGNFNLDMGRSPGFGSTPADFIALLRLGFPSAPDFTPLTSPADVTRRTVLQKVRGSWLWTRLFPRSNAADLAVSTRMFTQA